MKLRALLLALFAAWGSAACAEDGQYSYPPVIDNSTYQPGVQQPSRAPSNDAMFELLSRLEQLQSEVQGLRGQVEEQAHQIDELKRRQDNIYNDIDDRLQKLEPGGTAGAAAAPVTDEISPGAPQVPSEQQPSAESQPPVTATQTTGPQPAVPQAPQTAPEVTYGGPVPEPQAEEQAAPPAEEKIDQQAMAALPSDEHTLYQEANTAVKNGQYDQALLLLNKLVNDFPSSKYAEDAYFRLGVLNYTIKRDAAASRSAFEYLINNFPKGQKVSDAMLKLGFLEYDQHNPDKARELFKSVIAKYPGSSAATLANNKLQQMSSKKR